MNFNAEELKYLNHVLRSTSSYTIAQGRESVAPSVNHYKLMDKIKMYEDRLRYGWTDKTDSSTAPGWRDHGIDKGQSLQTVYFHASQFNQMWIREAVDKSFRH